MCRASSSGAPRTSIAPGSLLPPVRAVVRLLPPPRKTDAKDPLLRRRVDRLAGPARLTHHARRQTRSPGDLGARHSAPHERGNVPSRSVGCHQHPRLYHRLAWQPPPVATREADAVLAVGKPALLAGRRPPESASKARDRRRSSSVVLHAARALGTRLRGSKKKNPGAPSSQYRVGSSCRGCNEALERRGRIPYSVRGQIPYSSRTRSALRGLRGSARRARL